MHAIRSTSPPVPIPFSAAMPVAIVTGSGGLVGSECVRYFSEQGFEVIGLENDMRAHLFGPEASTYAVTDALESTIDGFRSLHIDVRDREAVERVLASSGSGIELIVHAAAQPSHDWAARNPHLDFEVNAGGTLNLLEAAREHCPDAPFIFCSTNKVYGDLPNSLPLVELESRFELQPAHRYYEHGIDTTMSIDRSTHSLFGVSKVAGDLMVQEYGRYFDMPTVCFRGGCLTGPNHAGAQLHGFLAYLMKCAVCGNPYTVFGYKGKQVRDNIHSHDLVRAFDAFRADPKRAAVYNIGGGRQSNCSMLEAIEICERISGRSLDWTLDPQNRVGDHVWWISDLREFRSDYPHWELSYGIEEILRDIHDRNGERWLAAA
jgi:CDP-paratose 2-epimerase